MSSSRREAQGSRPGGKAKWSMAGFKSNKVKLT